MKILQQNVNVKIHGLTILTKYKEKISPIHMNQRLEKPKRKIFYVLGYET